MGQSPEELKQDIETTRTELGETLDAIGDRVSPGRMIERKTNRVRQGLRGARDRVMGVAQSAVEGTKEHLGATADAVREAPQAGRQQTQGSPLVAGALAFGVGFLVASLLPKTAIEDQAAEQLADGIEPVKRQLVEAGRETAEHLKDPVREAVNDVKETATAGAQQVAEQARQGADDTVSAGQHAADHLQG
jgi:ElaB/YqjD/DUF883 family membrane-anchored ribosome-binding protein